MPTENKKAFIACLQAAFIAGDCDRYQHFVTNPVEYFCIGDLEYMGRNGCNANITGCSCAAIAKIFVEEYM